ncbi:MAG: YihY/virulence factor BrkB family protein [Phaeodactylibacter sp.]|uniref:YihY/virulence factor BrkB family protein n=1 Tax=Phaeodactylibacter sp. TaxID=1940289 RepID=UPI0032EE1D19
MSLDDLKSGGQFYFQVLKASVQRFAEREAFTYAASLSYYTIFSLPPMLMVIIYSTTLFYDRDAIRSTIFGEIADMLGQDSATQLANTLDQIGLFEGNWVTSAVSIGALLFTSTTVFATIQRALNRMYGVQAKPDKSGLLKMLFDRLTSFALLLSIGFILLVSLVIDTILDVISNFFGQFIPELSLIITKSASVILPIVVVSVLFTLLFRYLPDARLRWHDTIVGALLTTVLFGIGRYGISFYIEQSQTTDLYDAASSVMVIMLWVFYASLILLFGGVFTAVYAEKKRGKLETTAYSVRVRYETVEEQG